MLVLNLNQVLPAAERGHYAIGSFAPRYIRMIRAVLCAGQKAFSPIIVQISQRELDRYGITPREFANEFYAALTDEKITIPVVLHLDHTRDFRIIQDAIAARFTSVMIDASDQPLEQNIALTKSVVDYAHPRGVSVEAELGRIGRADGEGKAEDAAGFTDPDEAQTFVAATRVDALAVAVGTAHGVYLTRQPTIDYDRLRAIRARTPVPLVLHGGSGVPAEMMRQAFHLPGGGVSKVNIATDLELAMLQSLGRDHWMLDAECRNLAPGDLERARAAVEESVIEKITGFCTSQGRAGEFFAPALQGREPHHGG